MTYRTKLKFQTYRYEVVYRGDNGRPYSYPTSETRRWKGVADVHGLSPVERVIGTRACPNFRADRRVYREGVKGRGDHVLHDLERLG